jgi:hypothetical protein
LQFERLNIVCENYRGILLHLSYWGKTLNGELKRENGIWQLKHFLERWDFERDILNEVLNHPNVKQPLENKIRVKFDEIHSVDAEKGLDILVVTFMFQNAYFRMHLKKFDNSWFIFEYSCINNNIGWLAEFELDFIEKLVEHPAVRLIVLI